MALVVTAHETKYPDPLTMNPGDELKVLKRSDDEDPGRVFCENSTGKRGWVPENIIKIEADHAIARQGYDAREVTVMEGEIVRIERIESGWAWVTNMTNETGWVSMKNLKLVE